MSPLVIDVGGTNIKLCAKRAQEPLEFDTTPGLTPRKLVAQVKLMTGAWRYDRVSVGVPALVAENRVAAEPGNLGDGWIGFDFQKAFARPVRVINDAAMQALGAYDIAAGGRMLFLGLGTGVGSAIVSEGVVVAVELGDLRLGRGKLSERLGRDAFHRVGRSRWRRSVIDAATMLRGAFAADYVVLGGGKAGEGMLDPLPSGLRAGGNQDAFTGGFRLWEHVVEPHDRRPKRGWRIVS